MPVDGQEIKGDLDGRCGNRRPARTRPMSTGDRNENCDWDDLLGDCIDNFGGSNLGGGLDG